MTYFRPFAPEQTSRSVPAVDHWKRLERFLILGSEDGTYSIEERETAAENLPGVRECLRADGLRVVRAIVEVSASGRAPRNTPALQALAMASSPAFASGFTNATALAALPEVARTTAELCIFAGFASDVRGWGRALRSAIAGWYLAKPAAELASQMIKARDSGQQWTDCDLLRRSHPKAETPAHNALFQWAVEGELGHLATADIRHGELRQVYAFEQVKKASTEGEVVRWIEDDRLTLDMIPSEWSNSVRVWEALLESMPYVTMVRHLGKMTEVGLLAPHSAAAALVVARLMDRKRVANAKIHPIALLSALLEYKHGQGLSGIADALKDAFYLAFDNLTPSGRRIYLAIAANAPLEMSMTMAMAVVRSESGATIAGFHQRLWYLDVSRKDRLERACQTLGAFLLYRELSDLQTPDLSLPMQDAQRRAIPVDAFVLLTSGSAWSGDRHPAEALEEYRQALAIPAKLVVVAMTGAPCRLADPADAGHLEIAGFDASVPAVVADFLGA
jgi:60 kDa SS-A/Ro ribonucleoprotein